jgi:hypothetical protein
MTEIKPRDIIKLTYTNGEIAYSLVDEVSDTDIHLREPPDKSIVLNIVDGYIEDVETIELVYSAPITGIAVARNFVPGQSIVLVYKSNPEDEKVGLITQLEEDMIDVNVDGEMIYIDFGYVDVPEEFQSITLHGGFVFEMEDDFFIPESQHRFTLERQLTDFMDKLLSLPNQTSRSIRIANTIVQRFRELRQLFSNNNLEPQLQSFTPIVESSQVKWILPVVNPLEKGRRRRILYPEEIDSILDLRNLSDIQQGKNDTTGPSFKSIYKKLLNEFTPFVSDHNGKTITDNLTILLKKSPFVKRPIGKLIKDMSGSEVRWPIETAKFMPQVLVKPYSDPYHQVSTIPEVAHFASYYVLPVDYTRAFVPGISLLERTHYHQLAPFTHLTPVGEPVNTLSDCFPSVYKLLTKQNAFAKAYYSIHTCIQHLSPYLIYQNNVSLELYNMIQYVLKRHIQSYKQKIKLPLYTANPLIEVDHQSASEHQVSLLHTDNGSLYAITQCEQMNLDYTNQLDKHIEKRLDSSQIAPPVVKIYTSLDQLKLDDKIDAFYDSELDKTDYSVYKGLELAELIEHLVRVEYMPPPDAYLYAPYFLKKKRPVLNGEYAQLSTPNGMVYYKRINNVWKLDETCSGPYPCASDEPECTVADTTCIDVSFRLKQNLIHSILVDYQLDLYKNKAMFETFLETKKKQLTYTFHAKKRVSEQSILKYNNRLNSMGKSIVIVEQSPKTPLLYLILEKPIEERYTELAFFIRTFTRVAHESEDEHWLYCVTTGLKLLPRVFQELIKGYEDQQYREVLDRLEIEGSVKIDEGSIVTTHGGFPVTAIDLEYTFEDTVRTVEFADEPIFKLKREDDPLTPFLVELLNASSVNISVNVTPYYNFMIHKILSVQASPLLQSVALVLKFAEIEYNIVLTDKIGQLTKNQRVFQNLFTKFKQPFDVLTEKDIQKELKVVASYYEVKQLIQKKNKQKIGVQKTSSTVWDTFLPPPKVTVSSARTAYNTSMTILHLIEVASHKKVLRDGIYHLNTIEVPIVPEEAKHMMHQWKYSSPMSYTKTKLFMPPAPKLPHEPNIVQTVLPKSMEVDRKVTPDPREFDILINPLLDVLEFLGFRANFISETLSILYLQTFVKNIGRLFPSFILHRPTYNRTDSIPVTLLDISQSHALKLRKITDKTIFAKLYTFSNENIGLEQLLEDKEIDDMIAQFQLPRTNTDRDKYTFYIYTIFHKYITGCPSDNRQVLFGILQTYRDFLTQDEKNVFIDMDEIESHMLTAKALESNNRRVERSKLNADDKFIFDFRQMSNLDKNAQLGRSREYNKEQHDMEADLFGTGNEDNDRGDDGNGGEDGNGNEVDDDYD